VRPALLPDPRYPPLKIAQDTRFQAELAAAGVEHGDNAREELQKIANAYIGGENFVSLDRENEDNMRMDAAAEVLDRLAANTLEDDSFSRSRLLEMIATALKQEPLGQDLERTRMVIRLKDSIVALQQVNIESFSHSKILALRLRTIDLLQKMQNEPSFPLDLVDFINWWRRPILAPTLAELKSILSNVKARDAAKERFKQRLNFERIKAEAHFGRYSALQTTLKEITTLPPKFLLTANAPRPSPATAIRTEFTSDALKSRRLQLLNTIADLSKVHYESVIGARPRQVHASLQGEDSFTPAIPSQDLPSANVLTPLVELSRLILTESKDIQPEFTPPAVEQLDFKPLRFTLKPEAAQSLSGTSNGTLKELGIAIDEEPMPQIVKRLENEISNHAVELDDIYRKYDKPDSVSISKVGGVMVRSKTTGPLSWHRVRGDSLETGLPRFLYDANPGLAFPSKVGLVKVAGIADLLVVKQQLVGYEGADVAHIENMLKGESKTREVTARQEIESITSMEEEVITSEEKETTTNTRFETSSETEQTIKEEEALKAGATASASYGPTFSVTANVEASKSRSMEESQKAAMKYASDVTEKAASKIQNRVLQKSSLRVTTESIDKATHSWKNEGGGGNINGVYQYVNKVYEAQTYTYGKRTMLEFMVPEPGAFLFDGPKEEEKTTSKTHDLPEIPLFTVGPEALDADTVRQWIYKYGVTDCPPYPSQVETKTVSITEQIPQPKMTKSAKADLEVPNGYFFFLANLAFLGTPNSGANAKCTIGGTVVPMPLVGNGVWSQTVPAYSAGKTSVTVTTWNVESWSFTASALCFPTADTMKNWRIEAWQKIESRRQKLVAEREAKIAALNAELAAQAFNDAVVNPGFAGDNPGLNLITMREEMKKACISIMTDQHFDYFGAIEDEDKNEFGISEINFIKADLEGPYVKFFEQAFEWDQMTWFTYPYFWGRKENWFKKIAYEDPDPVFRDFMRAGYARANVPIRLGFEGAVDHFLATGDVWQGQGMPAIKSDLFLPIAIEIQESLGKKAGKEEKYGASWFVKIPTNLVTLRMDDKLPVWLKQPDGSWRSADDPNAVRDAITPQPAWTR
jgi:hypothetical protein